MGFDAGDGRLRSVSLPSSMPPSFIFVDPLLFMKLFLDVSLKTEEPVRVAVGSFVLSLQTTAPLAQTSRGTTVGSRSTSQLFCCSQASPCHLLGT